MRGGVEDRWYRKGDKNAPTARCGQGMRWMVRWVDDLGEERTKSFTLKAKAEQHEIVLDDIKLVKEFARRKGIDVKLLDMALKMMIATR